MFTRECYSKKNPEQLKLLVYSRRSSKNRGNMHPRYIILHMREFRTLRWFHVITQVRCVFFSFLRPCHGHFHVKKTLHIRMIAVFSVVGGPDIAVSTAWPLLRCIKERSPTFWLTTAAGAVLEVIIYEQEWSHESDAGKMMLEFMVDYRSLTADGTYRNVSDT